LSTVTAYENLVDALADAPSHKAFVTLWKSDNDVVSVSFGEFRRLAELKANYFREKGLESGDRIILIMPQSIDLMAAFVGAMMLGAVPSILAFPNSKVEPRKYMFGLSGVSANLKARLVVLDASFPSHLLNCVSADENAQIVRGFDDPLVTDSTPVLGSAIDSRSLAFIQHSSGTTGLQKGVALSHGAVLRHLDNLREAVELRDSDCIYSWLPLYHDMGLVGCFMFPMVHHIPIVMQSPTDWVMQPATMLKLITEYKCTLAWVPNFAFQFLARRVFPEDRLACNLSSLRCLFNCSEPVRAQSMDEFLAAFRPCGVRAGAVLSSYGLAENVFVATLSRPREGPKRIWVDRDVLQEERTALPVHEKSENALCLVSSGRPLPGTKLRIVSPEGEDLPEGKIGEILVHSDYLFDGYYNRPDLTLSGLRDGWHWTGDLGFCLNDNLYAIGRKKDMIIVAGKNIYPQDVEEIAFSHPSIHDGRAVAFGLYNPALGTEDIFVVAEVANEADIKNSNLIARAIRNMIVAELGVTVSAVYVKPAGWIIKSTAGKPARSSTRDKLLAEHPEQFRDPVNSPAPLRTRIEVAGG